MYSICRLLRFEDHERADENITLWCELLAWKSGTVYFVIACVRFFARSDTPGHKFTNHLFWVSFVSCLFCLVMGIGASYQREWSWKAEPISAAIMAVGCLVEGMRIIYVYLDDVDDLLTKHTRP